MTSTPFHQSVTLLAGMALLIAPGQAAPTETFNGEIRITDDAAGVDVDVNDDGILDLNLAYYGVSVNSVFGWDAVANEASSSADVRFGGGFDPNGRSVHDRFDPDELVGPAIDTGLPVGALAYGSLFDGMFGGPWLDQQPGFLGFSFLDQCGERHYGWAELELDNQADNGFGTLILTRVGYETLAREPIPAGVGGPAGCNPADLAAPFGTLDLADIAAFVTAFVAGTSQADLAEPCGVYDLADISAFVTPFGAGCP